MTGRGIIYGFDPLCGWCFGFAPALEALLRERPDIPVRLIMGGLVTGERIQPATVMADYIKRASVRLGEVTGRRPSERFFDRILDNPAVVSSSLPPTAALLQMRAAHPELELPFAKAIQHAYFVDGEDLNRPALYDELASALGVRLDFRIPAAAEMSIELDEEFSEARRFGLSSFPTILVHTDRGLGKLPSIYDPAAFVSAVVQHAVV